MVRKQQNRTEQNRKKWQSTGTCEEDTCEDQKPKQITKNTQHTCSVPIIIITPPALTTFAVQLPVGDDVVVDDDGGGGAAGCCSVYLFQ